MIRRKVLSLYKDLMRQTRAPAIWKTACANSECTFHQLAPYIGKLKSTIAAALIESYSRPGDLIVDPFSGAGTIPLEAATRGRRAFAADISPYAAVLSSGKLRAPRTLEIALKAAQRACVRARAIKPPDLRAVPSWVRRFFHPTTLRETIAFAQIAREPGNEFLMACLLGILHHQRPGFLSFPSSHLVPYLRNKKFPRHKYPSLYEYRELAPRLEAKIRRMYKRAPSDRIVQGEFQQSAVETLTLPTRFDALITSPPYMNALDYGRDNRLRLWFIDPDSSAPVDNGVTRRREEFVRAITSLAKKVQTGLRFDGYCVLVVGEELSRTFKAHPSEVVMSLMRTHAPGLILQRVITDDIPDVRRTRRECRGIKTEHVLVFRRGN